MTLQSLSHAAVDQIASPSFRAGDQTPDWTKHLTELEFGSKVDLVAVRTFVDEAMKRFGHSATEKTLADIWLAPRLHHALRLSRRQAAHSGLWRWLGAVEFPEYVRWRWGAGPEGEGDAAVVSRFAGGAYTQALSRLWWAAELSRNGDDYTPVMLALGKQDVQNNLFRMDIAHHRPTMQAVLRTLAGEGADAANALAKAMNSAATTLLIDVIGPDVPLSVDGTERWLAGAGDVDPVRWFEELPPGPDDGAVPEDSIAALLPLAAELLAEAPRRLRKGKGKKAGGPVADGSEPDERSLQELSS